MTIDRKYVQAWLERYIAAWKTYESQAIGDLFSVEAEYAYNPFDAPLQGREAIVKSWLSPRRRDKPGDRKSVV